MPAKILLTLFAFCFAASRLSADDGEYVPVKTLSPNKRYGVTVPTYDPDTATPGAVKNLLVDVKSRATIATIEATTGWTRMNHGEVLPARWSEDSSVLIWEVDGKWFPDALVVLKIEKEKVKWQTNVLKEAQQVILTRTKTAAPEKYAAAKKANAGNGSAYPEGFSIDVAIDGPVKFPLHVEVALTSNPKDTGELESHLEAVIDADGKLTVKKFGLGPGKSSHF